MKKIMRFKWLAIVVAAVLLGACSDGELMEPRALPLLTAPKPVVVSFTASPDKINAGESTTLSWNVTGADDVQVKSNTAGFSFDSGVLKELKSSAKVEKLAQTTEFILTAKKKVETPSTTKADAKPTDESKKETVLTTTASVTVTVNAAKQMTVTVKADKTEVDEGELTIIRWGVEPADQVAEVEVKDEVGPIAGLFTDEVCKDVTDPEKLSQMAVAEKAPVQGCAVVDGGAYTVTAKDKTGATANGAVTVGVLKIEVKAEILVDGKKSRTVETFETPVTVTWDVNPANANVSIVSTPKANCSPALPTGAVQKEGPVPANDEPSEPKNPEAAGEEEKTILPVNQSKCTLSADTVFEITAEYSGRKATGRADVVRISSAPVNLDVTADGRWGFVGDKMRVVVNPSNGAVIDKILVSDLAGMLEKKFIEMKPLELEVAVPEQGVRIQTVSGGKTGDEQVVIEALRLNSREFIKDEMLVSKVIFDQNKTQYVGMQLKYYNDNKLGDNKGTLKLYKGGNLININFLDLVKEGASPKINTQVSIEGIHKSYGDFPISAIAVRDGNPKQIFIATNGVVAVTNDGGEKWALVDRLLNFTDQKMDYKNYKNSFPTCGGLTRKGDSVEGENPAPGKIIGFAQTCDIVATKSGLVILATDKGIFSTPNIDEVIKVDPNWSENEKVNHYNERYKKWTKALNDVVANDLFCLDENCSKAYAATSKGVFISEDSSKTWKDFGKLSAPAYAIEQSANGLLVGTDTGVQIYSDGKWSKVEGLGNKVFSLAIDSAVDKVATVVAGTDKGAWVSHNAGKNWSQVVSSGVKDAGEVRSVAIATNTKKVGADVYMFDYMVALGTNKSAMSGMVSITDLMKQGANQPQTTPDSKPESNPNPTPNPTPSSDPNPKPNPQ